jgi:hypothetical protein
MFTENLIVATWDKGRTGAPPAAVDPHGAPPDPHRNDIVSTRSATRAGDGISNRRRGSYAF